MAYTYSLLHSFVNFDSDLSDVTLPAYNSFAIAFQFKLPPGAFAIGAGTVSVEIVDLSNATLAILGSAVVTDLCANAVITGIAENDFPTVNYQTKEDLFVALQLLGYSATGFTFYQCCCENLPDSTTPIPGITITFSRGVIGVVIPEVTMTGIVAMGQCFKYAVTIDDTALISNPFIRVENEYLTWMRYSNNESAYNLYYCNGTFENRIWLPMYCRKPAYPEDRKIYMKNNKTYKITKASIEKEWEVAINYFPDKIHDRIVVALAHDNIYFQNQQISDNIFKKDEYKIDWDEYPPIDVAQASFKVLQSFAGRNSNCEKPVPCAIVAGGGGGGCIGVSIPATSLPNATVGVAYDVTIPFSGDAPVILTAFDVPAWMDHDILTGSVHLTGSPAAGDEGTGITVSFTLSNCAGANTPSFTDTINVNPVVSNNICIQLVEEDEGTLAIVRVNAANPVTQTITVTVNYVTNYNTYTFNRLIFTGNTASTTAVVHYTSGNIDEHFTSASMSFSPATDNGLTFAYVGECTTLTFGFSTAGGFNTFTVRLSQPIDADVVINRMFADGYDNTSCGSGNEVSSAQINTDTTIIAGQVNGDVSPTIVTGDWSLASGYQVYNLIINSLQPINDGQAMTIGSYRVVIINPTCQVL